MNFPSPAYTGREYQRVSRDRSGRQKSNSEQHNENLTTGASLGVADWGEPYSDVGSASRYARKKRDDFPRLLEDISSGRFGADVLWLWESSRGSRKVSEWCQLIEACEAAQALIGVTTHHRIYNPANPRDRRSLIEDANDSEYESAKTSQRTRRDFHAIAAEGLPHSKTPYGYRRLYDPVTRRLVKQEANPIEAAIVVELYTRLAAGESERSICRDLAARGVTTRRGFPWTDGSIRRTVLSLAYRGVRGHSPGTDGYNGTPAFAYPAVWPALVDDDLWFAVEAKLRNPARLTYRSGKTKHLLSIVVHCDHCGGPLTATYRQGQGKRHYHCRDKGHVSIEANQLDAWAEDQLLDLLARPELLEPMMRRDASDDTALAAARDEVARARADHKDLTAKVGTGELTPGLAAGAEPQILARLKTAETTVRELAMPTGLGLLIEPGPLVASSWGRMTIEAKREVVKLLFAPGRLGALTIVQKNGAKSWRDRIRLDGQPISTE